MKIINRENNQNVTYIQQKNLKQILRAEHDIPKSLVKAMRTLNLTNLDDTHDEEFVRIEGQETALYLSCLSWIPDFRKIRTLSEKELQQKITDEKLTKDDLKNYYDSLSQQEQQESFHISKYYTKLEYKISDLTAYLSSKQGNNKQIAIPIAIDSEELHTDISEINCTVGISFDKTKIVLQKTDGSPFNATDTLPLPIVQSTITMLGLEAGLQQEEGYNNLTYYLEQFGNFFVAEYTSKSSTKESAITDSEASSTHKKSQHQKKKSLFQKIFKSNKKDEN